MTTSQTLDPSRAKTPATSAATARITLRTPLSRAGFVDGAWWPRTLDLVAELPVLVDTLAAAGHDTARVSYNLTAWAEAPRRVHINGHKIRLGGFLTSDPLTVTVVDTSGRKHIDLVVIAPDTDPATAERALTLAGLADSSARAGEILAQAGIGSSPTESATK